MPVADLTITPTTYVSGGLTYDRITEVLKVWPNPDLQDWRASVGKIRADKALRHGELIGRHVDKAITAFLTTNKVPKLTTTEMTQAFKAFLDWQALQTTSLLGGHAQETLLDGILRIGGTPDYYTQEGFEWKASSQMKLEYLLQADQYWRLLAARHIDLRQYRVVRFDKILATWEEVILRPDGVQWQDQWLTRDWLQEAFADLLNTYRKWRQVCR